MALRMFALLATLTVLAPTGAQADVRQMQLTGTATMELHERAHYLDAYTLETHIATVTFDVTGITHNGYEASARGTASVSIDGTERSVAVSGSMHPPLGSGGGGWFSGADTDGRLYCFRIFDYADAPTPRPDATIAAFQSGPAHVEQYVRENVRQPGIYPYPMSFCDDLDYKHAWVRDGDFTIAFTD